MRMLPVATLVSLPAPASPTMEEVAAAFNKDDDDAA